MAGGDVETVAAGSPQALVSGPRLGYRCAPVGDVDEHGGCGGPLCQHHHGRELPQWTAFYFASLRHLRNDCICLVPGGGPAGAASELEIRQFYAAKRECNAVRSVCRRSEEHTSELQSRQYL